jgi:RNA polymerase sigma-70 factor (ECF subfamily)
MLRIQEKILIHQVKKGNQNAFAKLYKEYVDEIYRFIFFKISKSEIAEEITQTVFTKALNYLLDGEKVENFRALLYQIARNLIIDFYRLKHQEVSLEEAKEIPFVPDYQKNLDQEIEIEKIKKYLSLLKPEQQEIILLRFFEGLSFKEIAKITGQSESNVRQIASRSIKILKKHLNQELSQK